MNHDKCHGSCFVMRPLPWPMLWGCPCRIIAPTSALNSPRRGWFVTLALGIEAVSWMDMNEEMKKTNHDFHRGNYPGLSSTQPLMCIISTHTARQCKHVFFTPHLRSLFFCVSCTSSIGFRCSAYFFFFFHVMTTWR